MYLMSYCLLQAVLGPLRAERDALVARHRQVLQRLEAEKDTYMAQVRHQVSG
jgi:hypothetical protein